MDSAQMTTPVGEQVREIFLKPIPGLPQPEPYFSIHRVNPFLLNSVLRSANNMVFITTFDTNTSASKKMQSYFTDNSIQQIQDNPDLFYYFKQNEFAKGQEVLYLFSLSSDSLANQMRNSQSMIRNHFHEIEVERAAKKVYAGKDEVGISNSIMSKHDCYIKVPYGYEVSKDEKNFIWLRQLDPEVDKSILISYTDYVSEDAFSPESILSYRDKLVGEYIADDSVVHMVTETLEPLYTETINLNGKYAKEARGLWKLNNNTMGGPFLSYTFVDEEIGRLYYIEGYLYCPGKKKRPFIREIEAILKTFRTGTEMKQQKAS